MSEIKHKRTTIRRSGHTRLPDRDVAPKWVTEMMDKLGDMMKPLMPTPMIPNMGMAYAPPKNIWIVNELNGHKEYVNFTALSNNILSVEELDIVGEGVRLTFFTGIQITLTGKSAIDFKELWRARYDNQMSPM